MADKEIAQDDSAKQVAREMGRRGGKKGGVARAAAQTPEERSEAARKAVNKRWAKVREEGGVVKPALPEVRYGSPDHPLDLGGIKIPCFVLDDGRRVLTQTGMLGGLGISPGGISRHGDNKERDRLARFASGKAIRPYMPSSLDTLTNPIEFRYANGVRAIGYEATVLADICEAVLEARAAGQLQAQQERIAHQCEILVRGFARVGLIALIDEATGYQYDRDRQSLAQILSTFISEELAKWIKTFPDEFYRQLFRLKEWTYSPTSTKRPRMAAKLTVDLVYERLAPGVLDELRRLVERDAQGRPKHKLFQRLTTDVGHPRLREHLATVVGLMKAFDTWDGFYTAMNRSLPKYNPTPMFPAVAALDGPELRNGVDEMP